MPEKPEWNWSEKLFKSISIPYSIISISIGTIIYMIFVFFEIELRNSEISQQNLIWLAEAVAVSYLLIGYQFLLNEMKLILSNISYLIDGKGDKDLTKMRKRFKGSYCYYLIIIFVIFPFLIINTNNTNTNPLDYIKEDMWLVFLFSAYAQIVGIIMLFLFANVLWIIINISWNLNDIVGNSEIQNTIISIYSFEAKIKSVRNSITKAVAYYFIGIMLLITTYLNPISLGKYEIIILIILLLTGAALFFIGLGTIQTVLKTRLEFEIDPIDKRIQEQVQKLFLLASEGDYNKIDQLNFISSTIDTLNKQKEELTKIDTRIYDLGTVSAFITSFLIPLTSLIDKIKPQILDFIFR